MKWKKKSIYFFLNGCVTGIDDDAVRPWHKSLSVWQKHLSIWSSASSSKQTPPRSIHETHVESIEALITRTRFRNRIQFVFFSS
jgi:hypothetical protein